MESREIVKVLPYDKYYQPVELFTQPSVVTNAHTRIQMHLQDICERQSIDLHTGIYLLSPDELPERPWTLAYSPGILLKRSCLVVFAHQGSEALWYFFLQMPWPAEDTLKFEKLLHWMIEDDILRDEGEVYVNDLKHERFHKLAEGIVWRHYHDEMENGRFDMEWKVVYQHGRVLKR